MPTDNPVELLRRVALSPDCAKMNRSTVKGYLGELLVKQQLEVELKGIRIDHHGNQSGHDLQYVCGAVCIKIDVKTSTAKDERKWGLQYWSWALQNKNKKKPVTATHLVCVGLNANLILDSLFVIRAENIRLFPPATGQFSNNTHCLFLPVTAVCSTSKALTDPLFHTCQRLLAEQLVVRVRPNEHLSDACTGRPAPHPMGRAQISWTAAAARMRSGNRKK